MIIDLTGFICCNYKATQFGYGTFF